MAGNDKRKQSLYFPDDMLDEIMRESIRLDRSLSWMVQRAWRIAHDEIAKFPSANPRAAIAPGGELRDAPRPPGPAPGTQPPPAAREARADPVATAEPQPGSQVQDFIRGKFDRK